jgi:hypothetical protein
MGRQWFVLAGVLAFQGCSSPPPTVFATSENDQIVFHIRDHGIFFGKIFGWDDASYEIDRFWVTRGNGTVIGLGPVAASPGKCRKVSTFPLRLGEKRCGFVWAGGSGELQRGTVYAIRLRSHRYLSDENCAGGGVDACRLDQWWSDSVIGAFIIKQSGRIVNLRPSEFPDDCGAEHAEDSSIEEQWAEHCLTEAQRE